MTDWTNENKLMDINNTCKPQGWLKNKFKLTYSSSSSRSWSFASSTLSAIPEMTTGSEVLREGNRMSTLYVSMNLRMVRPLVPIKRRWTRGSIGTSTLTWSSYTKTIARRTWGMWFKWYYDENRFHCCLRPLWLARVIVLVLVSRHLIDYCYKQGKKTCSVKIVHLQSGIWLYFTHTNSILVYT